jgi:hypothetical protein
MNLIVISLESRKIFLTISQGERSQSSDSDSDFVRFRQNPMKFDKNLVGRCSDPVGSDNRIPTDRSPTISVRVPNGSYRIPIGRNPIVRSDRITTPSDEVPVEFHRILSESDEWKRSSWDM